MWQYPHPMESGAAVIPGINCPCTLQLHVRRGAEVGSKWGVTWAGDVWLVRSTASPCAQELLEDARFWNSQEGEGIPWHCRWVIPHRQCCLLWTGLLQVTPCLKAQGAKERFCYLMNPKAGVWVGSCHMGPVAALGAEDGRDVLLHQK